MPAAIIGTVDQVAARVGELIIEEVDILLAESCLFEASGLVRAYAGQAWPNPALVPDVAVGVVIAAAARAYQNPGGFVTERADMASLKRGDYFSVGASLTPSEIVLLKQLGVGGGGIISVGMTSPEQLKPRSQKPSTWWRGYAPVDWGGNKPFPMGEGIGGEFFSWLDTDS